MQTIWMKRGSLWPPLQATLNLQRSGNLAGTTVSVRLLNQDTGTWAAYTCTIDNEESGEVSYQWQTGQTDEPGTYWMEFWVTVPSVGTMIVPDDTFLNLTITDHLGSGS